MRQHVATLMNASARPMQQIVADSFSRNPFCATDDLFRAHLSEAIEAVLLYAGRPSDPDSAHSHHFDATRRAIRLASSTVTATTGLGRGRGPGCRDACGGSRREPPRTTIGLNKSLISRLLARKADAWGRAQREYSVNRCDPLLRDGGQCPRILVWTNSRRPAVQVQRK